VSQYEIDYLHDKRANRLDFGYTFGGSRSVLSGFTFENRDFNAAMKKEKMGRNFRFGSRQ
jgi:hypothetical protein